MSTTTTTTVNDLTITRTATHADAELLVSIMNGPIAQRSQSGTILLMGYAAPPTLAQLTADHPAGSEGHLNVMSVLGLMELIGTFVKQGLLDRALVHDLLWVTGMWTRCALLAEGIRAESGEPAMYENFEALAR